MANNVVDLWPSDLVVSDEMSPALLLRQQAERLRQRTNGRVEAEVTIRFSACLKPCVPVRLQLPERLRRASRPLRKTS
jgi:hypothetical protein